VSNENEDLNTNCEGKGYVETSDFGTFGRSTEIPIDQMIQNWRELENKKERGYAGRAQYV
jgi:hypothetical protein